MSEEVKEILDDLRNINNYDYSEICDNENNIIEKEYDIYLSKNKIDLLLDCITNLQEELRIRDTNWQSLKYYLEKLYDRDYIEEEIFDDICNRVNELESQIEIKSYQKEITNLQEKNERLNTELNAYKSRCEKANEYIKSFYETPEDIDAYDITYYWANKVMEILNGGDE